MSRGEPRKSRKLWAESNGEVLEVVGYECPPNKDVWWIPQLGFSGQLGGSVFDNPEAARKDALKRHMKQLKETERAIQKLEG